MKTIYLIINIKHCEIEAVFDSREEACAYADKYGYDGGDYYCTGDPMCVVPLNYEPKDGGIEIETANFAKWEEQYAKQVEDFLAQLFGSESK